MSENNSAARWYVAHTYSGYENKVKMDLEKTIENRHLQDLIFEVNVPMQPVIEMKNGAEKKTDKKMFPGYVLVKMIMNQETWYVVRNTRGVTGFVGPGSEPIPLSEEEVLKLSGKESEVVVDFEIGEAVTVISGAWNGSAGIISEINDQKKTVTLSLEIFGRETPVELSYGEIQKLR
ncbi:MAG TPA: transcription termination/antitermination factor NusG [Oribacterium sp.]|jgi:transcription antitermination protein nusG|nr:transcription termination/antitermination factor NusG [Oribacterium sp.]